MYVEVAVAGRPPEIAGIEGMVGLFINTLPLRVKLPPLKSLRDLLKEVQDSQSKLITYQYLGLAEIQSLLGVGELFDTLVVFENYPLEVIGGHSKDWDGLRLAGVSGHDATHYPLISNAYRNSSPSRAAAFSISALRAEYRCAAIFACELSHLRRRH